MNQVAQQDIDFGLNLLEKRRKKEISMKEFLKECTYFSLKCGFDDYHPKPLPTRPDKMLEYDRIKGEGKDVTNKFWEDLEIQTYLTQKTDIIHWNLSRKSLLKDLLARLESYGDPNYPAIVRQRIQEFAEWEQDNYSLLRKYIR